MEIAETPRQLIEQLRSWFHPKDRSIYLAPDAFAYLPGGVGYLSMAFISETVLSASAASVTFSNIPQDFRHLMIAASCRVDTAAERDNIAVRFNGDSGANYDTQSIFGTSATPTASATRGAASLPVGSAEAANSRGNAFGPNWIWIFQYSAAGIEKQTISFFSTFGNLSTDADLFAIFRAGNWRNLNVITSITILPSTGPNFVSGSRFQLYGIL